jgi:hypothetical protein
VQVARWSARCRYGADTEHVGHVERRESSGGHHAGESADV